MCVECDFSKIFFLFTNFRIYSFVKNLFHFLRSVHLYIHIFALLSGGEIEIVTVNWLVFPDLNIITILSFCCIWWHLLKWDFQNRKKCINWFCGVNSRAAKKDVLHINKRWNFITFWNCNWHNIILNIMIIQLRHRWICGGEADFKWFSNLWCEF